jgi:hypothetical protein
LLGSALAVLLLAGDGEVPVYFSSPWISDFALLGNHYREVVPLFPDSAEQSEIRFVDYLLRLSEQRPVRIITTDTKVSRTFLSSPVLAGAAPARLEARIAPTEYHEKGILAPGFYIEGSMNITFSGVYVRDEKVTYHAASDPVGRDKVARAYLEFDRRWETLRGAPGRS